MTSVLIVENHFAVAHELRRILEDAGYEVIGLAPDTHAAVALAEEKPPEIAIVDLKLAVDLDGVKTAAVMPSDSEAGSSSPQASWTG